MTGSFSQPTSPNWLSSIVTACWSTANRSSRLLSSGRWALWPAVGPKRLPRVLQRPDGEPHRGRRTGTLGSVPSGDIGEVIDQEEWEEMELGLQAVPGADDAVRAVVAAGMAVCVGSNGSPDAIAQRLGLTGLYHWFEGGCSARRWCRTANPTPTCSCTPRRRWGSLLPSAWSSRTAIQASRRPGSRDEGPGLRGKLGQQRRRIEES